MMQLQQTPACSSAAAKQSAPAVLSARRVLGARTHFLGGAPLRQQHADAQPCTSGRRSAVSTQANLFGRITRVGRSYSNEAVKKMEDPRKLLDQAVIDMRADLGRMKEASSQVLATQRMLEDKVAKAQGDMQAWSKRAEVALRAGEEGLAREALKRRKSSETALVMLEKQLEQHSKAYGGLLGSVRALELKVVQAESKKETLKARATSAEAAKLLNDEVAAIVGGLSSSANSSVAAFARMEERVMAMEAEAEALGESGLLLGGTSSVLEQKFLALESVDDELLQLKAEMADQGRVSSRSLPEQSSTLRRPSELEFPRQSYDKPAYERPSYERPSYERPRPETDVRVTWR